MTRPFSTLLLLAALAAPVALAQTPAAPAAAAKPAAAKPYLTVNGTPIPQHTADAFIAEQKLRGVDTAAPAFQTALREEMIRRGVLLAEAKKQSLDKRPAYKQQLEFAAQLLLMREAIAEHLKRNPITEAELTAAYQAALVQLGNNEYRLRHIQSASEAEAREIIAQLDDGKKFDKLLKRSTDEATRDKGGDIGWKIPVALPPEIAAQVRPLQKGGHTKIPLKLGDAWHVFQLAELRPLTPPKQEELAPQLRQAIAQRKTAQYLDSLKAVAQIK